MEQALVASYERLNSAKSAAGLGFYYLDFGTDICQTEPYQKELWGAPENQPFKRQGILDRVNG